MKKQKVGQMFYNRFKTKIIVVLVVLLSLFGFTSTTFASHIVGGALSYSQVGANTYSVRLAIYRDCDGISLPNSVPIRSQTFGGILGNVTRTSITDISILCPGQTSSCASPSSPTPGIEEHIYQGVITINPTPGGTNTIYYTQCCRPTGINTLINSQNQGVTFSTTVNTALTNNSPVFLNPPTGQYCVGQLASLSLNAFDPDGDVIRYKLVDALGTNFAPINYAGTFSGISPLSSSTPITIDSVTGLINFTPSAIERAIITVEATEFRNGSPIGSIRRDIEVVGVSCASNTIPSITAIGNSIVHVGDSICIPVVVTDVDGDALSVTASGAILPPATFTIDSSGPGATYATFCYTPQLTDTGNTFAISINAQDDNCPVPGTAVTTFNITVPRPCNVTTTSSVTPTTCGLTTGTASSTLNGGVAPYSYAWDGPASFSSSNQSISNLAAGFYYVSIIDGNNCVGEDTVEVLSSSPVSITASNTGETCDGSNGTLTVSVQGGTAPYSYILNAGTPQASNTFTNLPAGSYSVSVSDVNGCSNSGVFTVAGVPDTIAPTAICKNYVLNLTNGSGMVSVNDVDNGSTDNCGIASISVSPNSFTCADVGVNTVTLIVGDAAGNLDSCTSTVTVQYAPSCTISVTPSNSTNTGGVPTNIYLGYGPQSATMNVTASGGANFSYSWSPATDLSSSTSANPVFTPSGPGNYIYTVTVTNDNGCTTTCDVTFCVLDIQVPGKKGKASKKVYMCHIPPGNPSNAHTISISTNAIAAHLAHGDQLGQCGQDCNTSNKMPQGTYTVFPNPSTDDFKLLAPREDKELDIRVYDINGRVIHTAKMQSQEKTISFGANFATGLYLIRISDGEEVVEKHILKTE